MRAPDATRAPKYLTAAEAAARLGVHRATLYSYVSRGQVRAEPDPRNAHASRYVTADVERLCDRKQARVHPAEAARKSLHFGLPVLQSALTLIENGRFFYRGRDAIDLARTSTFEHVVDILWQADASRAAASTRAPVLPAALAAAMRSMAPAERLQIALLLAARFDRCAADVGSRRLAATGWRIVRALLSAATLRPVSPRRSAAGHLAAAWKTRHDSAIDMLNAALILCADHELNVSAFTVRVAASAGSSPYDAILAGLCALRGARHGGQTELVEQLLEEARSPSRLRTAIERRLRRGDRVPGFGHLLYPDGDPRGRLLSQLICEACPSSVAAEWTRALQRSGAELLDDFPTIDVGLVLLRRALHLPRGCAFLLFAIGRSAGWIAHAAEQYGSSELIRPRALYSGIPPQLS